MPYQSRLRATLAAIALTTGGLAIPLSMNAETTSKFAAYSAESTAVVNTTPYSEFLSALTIPERGRTLVAYEIAHAQGLPFMREYADYLAGVPVSQLNRDEQLAYWLNTRNFLLIHAIAEERRVRGYKNKRGTPSDPGSLWTSPRITVEGTSLSLQDIEEDILFAGWDDLNIVFGLYQGVKGGPALPREPFTGSNVTDQLAEAARRFNSLPNNLRVRGDKVRISSYYDWYLPFAFGGSEETLRTHLSGLAKPADQQTVANAETLDRRKLSTDFEQYRVRQAAAGSGNSGRSVRSGGFGS
ncbi:MAG: DUF547 domain-containing protein [Henriciella sp.]|nr:DUF547 domain-containing protein [Henriciella sp.]